MAKDGPILLVDDDEEDKILIFDALNAINVTNELIFFKEAILVLQYLLTTSEKPFIIICDINMPKINGLELRSEINNTEFLRKKSIPFVFLSTAASREDITIAYDLTVQGFFIKPHSFEHLKTTLRLMVDYWFECKHPNT